MTWRSSSSKRNGSLRCASRCWSIAGTTLKRARCAGTSSRSGSRGGVLHPKVAVLVWENAVRVIVASANLTAAGYRSQLECAVVLDFFEGGVLPVKLLTDVLDAVRSIVGRAAGDPREPGPKQRALEGLQLASRRGEVFNLPDSLPRKVQATIATADSARAVLEQLMRVWRGGPPRRATVLSPYFDTADGTSAAVLALTALLAERGRTDVTFVVAVEHLEARTIVRAPRSLLTSLPSRVHAELRGVAVGEGEVRRLHAKVLLLDSDEWTAALVGSSNFTAAGLGLIRGAGNVEVNLAIGAPARSREAEALRALVPIGDLLDLDTAEWIPEPDDESGEHELPAGFLECLLKPGTPPVLIVRLDTKRLPERWSVTTAEGATLVDSEMWVGEGRPPEIRAALAVGKTPFFVQVKWSDGAEEHRAGWPVNVTEPGLLPPPDELRDLPVEALLRALASTRPLHEALATALRELRAPSGGGANELDPLLRYSASGHLFQRTRRLSAALAGLQARLERPASNLDALVWRLEGPFGPKAVAEGLLRDVDESRGAIRGEASFLIAELALTLARVDWRLTGRTLGIRTVRRHARAALRDVCQLAEQRPPKDRQLAAYVAQALREAEL